MSLISGDWGLNKNKNKQLVLQQEDAFIENQYDKDEGIIFEPTYDIKCQDVKVRCDDMLDVENSPYGINEVMQMKTVLYRIAEEDPETTTRRVGVLSHHGMPEVGDKKVMSMSCMLAVLTKACQDLQKQVNELKQKLDMPVSDVKKMLWQPVPRTKRDAYTPKQRKRTRPTLDTPDNPPPMPSDPPPPLPKDPVEAMDVSPVKIRLRKRPRK